MAPRVKFDARDLLGEEMIVAAYRTTSAEGDLQPTPIGTTVFDLCAILASTDEVDGLISRFQNLQGNIDPES